MDKLNTILAATDFSESADHAVEYAAALAEKAGAALILMHAFHVPVVASEVPTLMFTLGEMEKEGMDQLKIIENKLIKKYPGLKSIWSLCLHGFAVETIESQVEKNKADLVVMGLKGSGFFSEKVIGSNSDALAREAKFPVLIVNSACTFKGIKRILFASDNREIKNHTVLEPLKTIAKTFGAHVSILHVSKKTLAEIPVETAVEGLALNRYLESVAHHFFEESANNLVAGLNAFAKDKQIDLTVALARNHGFFESIFSKNHVHDMVYHTNTPLLILHEPVT